MGEIPDIPLLSYILEWSGYYLVPFSFGVVWLRYARFCRRMLLLVGCMFVTVLCQYCSCVIYPDRVHEREGMVNEMLLMGVGWVFCILGYGIYHYLRLNMPEYARVWRVLGGVGLFVVSLSIFFGLPLILPMLLLVNLVVSEVSFFRRKRVKAGVDKVRGVCLFWGVYGAPLCLGVLVVLSCSVVPPNLLLRHWGEEQFAIDVKQQEGLCVYSHECVKICRPCREHPQEVLIYYECRTNWGPLVYKIRCNRFGAYLGGLWMDPYQKQEADCLNKEPASQMRF